MEIASVDRLSLLLLLEVVIILLHLLLERTLHALQLAHHPVLRFYQVVLVLLNHVLRLRDDLLKVVVLMAYQIRHAIVQLNKLQVHSCQLFNFVLHRLH